MFTAAISFLASASSLEWELETTTYLTRSFCSREACQGNRINHNESTTMVLDSIIKAHNMRI